VSARAHLCPADRAPPRGDVDLPAAGLAALCHSAIVHLHTATSTASQVRIKAQAAQALSLTPGTTSQPSRQTLTELFRSKHNNWTVPSLATRRNLATLRPTSRTYSLCSSSNYRFKSSAATCASGLVPIMNRPGRASPDTLNLLHWDSTMLQPSTLSSVVGVLDWVTTSSPGRKA
jgi:hypothetical protein